MSNKKRSSKRQLKVPVKRFSYRHLAQLKYLFPEAIEVKKILVRDELTSCMKPDLVVSLDFGVIQKDGKKAESGNLRLRKLFRKRLVEFCKNNPEGDEVPEDTLPEPFNKSSQVSLSIPVEKPNVVSVPDVAYTISQGPLVAASHIPPSFKRHFSRPVPTQNVETAEQVVDRSIAKVVCVPNVLSPVKCSAKLPETPIKNFDLDKKKDLSSVDGTHAKHIFSPFSATPAQASRPLVRGIMTPDEDSMMSLKKLTRHASDTIMFFFQSIKRSVSTKEELMHMIFSSQLGIVDQREVDEQLRLLQELAPEWIYQKVSTSGDLSLLVK